MQHLLTTREDGEKEHSLTTREAWKKGWHFLTIMGGMERGRRSSGQYKKPRLESRGRIIFLSRPAQPRLCNKNVAKRRTGIFFCARAASSRPTPFPASGSSEKTKADFPRRSPPCGFFGEQYYILCRRNVFDVFIRKFFRKKFFSGSRRRADCLKSLRTCPL